MGASSGSFMAHKSLTISDEAYNALVKQRKTEDESFTKVILRLAKKKESNMAQLERYIDSIAPDEELASALEQVVQKRSQIRIRADRTS